MNIRAVLRTQLAGGQQGRAGIEPRIAALAAQQRYAHAM